MVLNSHTPVRQANVFPAVRYRMPARVSRQHLILTESRPDHLQSALPETHDAVMVAQRKPVHTRNGGFRSMIMQTNCQAPAEGVAAAEKR